MAASVVEVARQTPFTIGSSQRLANRARTQRVDSTALREDRGGGSGTESDGMGALRKNTVEEKRRESCSVITYFHVHTQKEN